jgi:hypothetical protein
MPITLFDNGTYTCSSVMVKCCYLQLETAMSGSISGFAYAYPRVGLWTNLRIPPHSIDAMVENMKIPRTAVHFCPLRSERAIMERLKCLDYFISASYIVGPDIVSDLKLLKERAELYGIVLGKLFSTTPAVRTANAYSISVGNYCINYNPWNCEPPSSTAASDGTALICNSRIEF